MRMAHWEAVRASKFWRSPNEGSPGGDPGLLNFWAVAMSLRVYVLVCRVTRPFCCTEDDGFESVCGSAEFIRLGAASRLGYPVCCLDHTRD